jgi:hypothetical protein
MIFDDYYSNASSIIAIGQFTANDLLLLIERSDYAVYFLVVLSAPPLSLESLF